MDYVRSFVVDVAVAAFMTGAVVAAVLFVVVVTVADACVVALRAFVERVRR